MHIYFILYVISKLNIIISIYLRTGTIFIDVSSRKGDTTEFNFKIICWLHKNDEDILLLLYMYIIYW